MLEFLSFLLLFCFYDFDLETLYIDGVGKEYLSFFQIF
jgi:hypothetical protein